MKKVFPPGKHLKIEKWGLKTCFGAPFENLRVRIMFVLNTISYK
jgi:hypothetical protein